MDQAHEPSKERQRQHEARERLRNEMPPLLGVVSSDHVVDLSIFPLPGENELRETFGDHPFLEDKDQHDS